MPSIQDKTIRPGSLISYSYYGSDSRRRQSGYSPAPAKSSKVGLKKSRQLRRGLILLAIVLVVGGSLYYSRSLGSSKTVALNSQTTQQTSPKSTAKTPTPAPKTNPVVVTTPAAAPNPCANNTLDELVLVSVSARHLWACNQTTMVYNSPVVTGDEENADTITPIGTYHIHGKERNVTLTGSDSNGSWNDPVSYWMPFLYNQYGAYGLHDATWRSPSDFGNIAPDSSNASHGCVELPLATAAWLYNWTVVGTTVTIES